MKNGLIIDSYGNRRWYKDNLFHREDGPAIERNDGYKAWYLCGKRHREDGPAVELSDGNKIWYHTGKVIKCSCHKEKNFINVINKFDSTFVEELAKYSSRLKWVSRLSLSEIENNTSILYFPYDYLHSFPYYSPFYNPSKREIIISYEMPRASHEIAHMIEIKDLVRLTEPDFGFKQNSFEKLSDKVTVIAAVVEIRVRAIQSRLTNQKILLSTNPEPMKEIKKIFPYKKLKSLDDFKKWENTLWQSTYDFYSFDKIKSEWVKRINYLHSWMDN